MTCRETFTDIYDRKVWGDDSGGGSSPEAAAPFVELANLEIAERKPRTVLDLGCGTGWVASRLNLQGAHYIGIDCVELVIKQCRETHAWAHGAFYCLDILHDPLPPADLVLCKEVTQHLSDANVAMLLERLKVYPAILHCSVISDGVADSDGGCRGVYIGRWDRVQGGTVKFEFWEHGATAYVAELWEPGA